MGTWGYKIYDDDLTKDIKEDFLELIRKEMTSLEATLVLKKRFFSQLSEDEIPLFWFALADVQWDYGILLEEVKDNANYYLSNEQDLKRWGKDDYIKRKNELLKLSDKINKEQLAERKIKKINKFVDQWEIGDIYAYKLEGEYAKEKNIYGKYILFHKFSEREIYEGHICPIVYLKIVDTLNDIFYKFEEYPYLITNKEIPDNKPILFMKAQMGHIIDDSELLFVYAFTIFITSKRQVPKDLIFIGNKKDFKITKQEYFPDSVLSLPGGFWKFLDKIIVDIYQDYNQKVIKK
jgi:hypothetical protein